MSELLLVDLNRDGEQLPASTSRRFISSVRPIHSPRVAFAEAA